MTPSHPDGTAPPAPARPAAPDDAALRAERARVRHWRRLVRARTDLAVAALALPEALGTVPSLGLEPPSYLGLLDAVSAGGPEGEIDRLGTLRALDHGLAAYEAVVTRALHGALRPVVQPPAAPARVGTGRPPPRTWPDGADCRR